MVPNYEITVVVYLIFFEFYIWTHDNLKDLVVLCNLNGVD